jgi:GTPase SAR1 family protein
LPDFLQEAGRYVGTLGAEFAADRGRLDALRQRLRDQRCHLAVLGQFKRGKSTLVNALLGKAVLPTAIVPLTSIPTFLHGGEQLAARVFFNDGKPEEHFSGPDAGALAEFLARFVTESANPHNRLGVRQVEVTYRAPVLEKGVALIDTPGIGSTFRHNTEATINFLPQCDAALFVVSADPPITEVEVEFLKLAHRKLSRLFFVLNKADYLDADERKAAVEFLQRVLCEQVGFATPPPVYCASARQGLAARREGNSAAWQESGMAEIEYRIVDFLLTEKTEVLNSAVSRQAVDLLADVERRLKLTLHSLKMPLAELDERVRLFEESLAKIDEQRIVLMNRLGTDEQRIASMVRKRADQLLPKSRKFLEGVVRGCEDQDGAKWSEERTREAIAAAIPGFFEREFGEAHRVCEQELREALLPHRRRADELIAEVHHLVEKLFAVPFEPQHEEISLAKAELPYWRTHQWKFTSIGSIPDSWIDQLFPQRWRHARIRRRIMEQVEYLVVRNVGDLRFSTLENLKRSVQDFRDALTGSIERTMQTTRRALDSAVARRTKDATTVAPEMARLESAIADLQGLRARLGHVGRAEGRAAPSAQGNGDNTIGRQ